MKKTLFISLFILFCISINLSATAIQGGLIGKYYNSAASSAPSWNNFQYEQVDSTINFNWGSGSPNSTLLGADIFSIMWTGWVMIDVTGTYYFSTTSDDSSMLYIDGTTVVSNGGNHAATTITGSIYLTAGLHEMVVTFHEYQGSASVILKWADSSQSYSVIDSGHLYYGNSIPEPASLSLMAFVLISFSLVKKLF